MTYKIDRDYVIQTASEMVKVDSTNPSLSPDGKGEAELGAYVADELKKLGLSTELQKIEPGRVNVVGTLKGTGGGKSLLLNAHLDTVGVDGMIIDPFGGEIKDGRLYGRGSQDMKGSLAAMMGAAKALIDGGFELAGDLLITGSADEEYASVGSEDLVKRVSADGAIVTEPTDLMLCRAHRGFIWHEVETFGRAAHGSRFEEGIDANMRMGRFLAQLEDLEKELRDRSPHPLVGPPSLHAARIKGGTEISIYAAHCLLEIERRTNPGETVEDATTEIQAIIDRMSADDQTFKAKVTTAFSREPFEVKADAPIVRVLEEAMIKTIGKKPPHSGQTFWTDAALFAAAGMETALVGPIGYGLHSKEEWVDVESVVDLAHILADTAISYCK